MKGIDLFAIFQAMSATAGVPADTQPARVEQQQTDMGDSFQFILEFWLN